MGWRSAPRAGGAGLFQLELLQLVLQGNQGGLIAQGLLGELAVAAYYIFGAIERLEVGFGQVELA